LVELTPDGLNRNKGRQKLYRLQILLWENKTVVETLYVDDSRYTLKQIQPVLAKIIDDLAKRRPRDMADLSIEFFLPRELISCEVDQWVKPHPLYKQVKIGTEHKVVVRSLDRARNPTLHTHWWEKWQELQAKGMIPGHPYVARLCV